MGFLNFLIWLVIYGVVAMLYFTAISMIFAFIHKVVETIIGKDDSPYAHSFSIPLSGMVFIVLLYFTWPSKLFS